MPQSTEGWLIRTLRASGPYAPQSISMLGSVGVAISGRIVPFQRDGLSGLYSVAGAVFCVSVLAGLAGGVKALHQAHTAKGQAEELARLEHLDEEIRRAYRDLIRLELQKIAGKLSFEDGERISIYKHHGKAFIMLGRWAKNPVSEQPGRALYPADQGCVGTAWRKGTAFDSGLPDPQTQEAEYRKVQKSHWSIAKADVEGLRMKARSYAAYRLHHPIGGKGFAVVVFESLDPNRLSEQRLESFGHAERQNIVEWLETMERFEPKPSYAKEQGY